MSDYIIVFLPDTIIQILLIIFLCLAILLHIQGYRTEKKKRIEVERLKRINDEFYAVFGMPWKEGRDLIKSNLEKGIEKME